MLRLDHAFHAELFERMDEQTALAWTPRRGARLLHVESLSTLCRRTAVQ